ncbi:hypothetical protein OG508_03300 [Streptomyces sp. NBC_01108]|uniref:hypothetical protein n=1 Tax=Streptomyces sp. NBC_01108 TaxID=2903751 RepID=UPI0038736416|nr:hypothetical protein OG508_03300 [Streptomyces sp. NBC_01108]
MGTKKKDDGASFSGGSGNVVGSAVMFGSNCSDPAGKSALPTLTSAASASAKAEIDNNTVDHNTFQQGITSYLQGTPGDLFTWFAGYRIQYFAAQCLAQPIDTRPWRWPRRDDRRAGW